MKVFSRQDLRQQLRRRELHPVYLLFGTEAYLRNLAARTITEIALKNSALREFNESEISLNNSNVGDAIAVAEQLPMMDSMRVVRVSDAVVSAKSSKDNIKEGDEGVLKRYLSNPSESSVLIIVADELDKRRKISKLLLNKTCPVEFRPLDDNEMVAWAKEKLKESNTVAEGNAVKTLVGLVGNDVRKLTLELEKLVTAALPKGLVTDQLVLSLAPSSRILSNFELADFLLSRNKTGALQVMQKILDDGAEPLMILGLLSYNFHRLFLAKELMNEGVDETEVSRVVRLPYRKKQNFLEQARRTDRRKFSWILKRLAETDVRIKTSVATPRLQIEMLICELATT